jgi:hypothetical protein
MKLFTLLSLLSVFSIETSQATRVNLDKGKKSVSSKMTIEKINQKIQKMELNSNNNLHQRVLSGKNQKSKAALSEPKYMEILNFFTQNE